MSATPLRAEKERLEAFVSGDIASAYAAFLIFLIPSVQIFVLLCPRMGVSSNLLPLLKQWCTVLHHLVKLGNWYVFLPLFFVINL